jgi:hypothetical protein
VSADQPEDEHGLRLPDTMCPILSLQVHLRILHRPHRHFSTRHFLIRSVGKKKKTTHPILVIKHDGVRRGEVDAQPTRTRTQKEESWGVRLVSALLETIHLRTAFQWARRTVYAALASV